VVEGCVDALRTQECMSQGELQEGGREGVQGRMHPKGKSGRLGSFKEESVAQAHARL